MLYKTTNNDTDDFVVVASYCLEKPRPPEQAQPTVSPSRPKPPKINWGVSGPEAAPACPPMQLKKFTKQDGSCWAMYVPPAGAQISNECGVNVAPFPASGC